MKELASLLEKIEYWDEIERIIPGRVRQTKSQQPFRFAVQAETSVGYKCVARSSTAAQEVFFILNDKEAFLKRLKAFL